MKPKEKRRPVPQAGASHDEHSIPAQPALFTPGPAGSWRVTPAADPPARRNGPETSKAAARSMRCGAKTLRARVLRFFVEASRDGATDEQCQQALNLKPQTETARRNELVRDGLVRDSGRRRKTSSGRRAIVWMVRTGAEWGEP